MPTTTRAQSVRSTSRTASPDFETHDERYHSSQHSASTPLSRRNLRSSGQPAEHVDVDHLDISHLSREAIALLEDDLAHIPGSQGSPRLRASARLASPTPSRGSNRDSKARRGKSSSARRIEDISVTEDDDDLHRRLLPTQALLDRSSKSVSDEGEPTHEADVEVEAWRENLNPVNATLVDSEPEPSLKAKGNKEPIQIEQDDENQSSDDSDATSDSGSDTSTASDATATPGQYATSTTARESEDDVQDEEDLDDLFQRALAKAREAQEMDAAGLQDDLQADVMVVAEKVVKERPIPGLSVPHIPDHGLNLSSSKTKQRSSKSHSIRPEKAQHSADEDRGEGSSKGKTQEPELDTATYQPELSRKQKAKQPQPKSASQDWASLPSIPSSLLPQMKRDYQAMNLANSLDPKRFMKGGAKTTKIPENFAIGTIINPPKRLQSTTLAKERKYNPGSIVQGLVANSEINSYAKRKFDEFASTRMANGRGKGWKKRKDGDW